MIYYLIFIFIMSLITLILYIVDKRRAINNSFRISEKTLILFSVFGGALGAIFGMRIFRHKTKHLYFYVINYLSLFLHIVILVLIALKNF